MYPEIAAEWDYERNGNLRPTDVAVQSNKKVSWICAYGHSWEAKISSRTQGNGCPYCAGRYPIIGKTDLATIHPQIAAEWDYERNGNLRPTDVSSKSGMKVFWLCRNGHSWDAVICDRTKGGTGCPFCSGQRPIVGETDLATTYPEVAAEWDYERNGDLRPTDVSSKSGKKVFWLCRNGHSWNAAICNRTQGNRCPYCAGRYPIVGETDLATLYPEVASEWDYERNGDLRPTDVAANSNKKVYWRCKNGHSWETRICERTKGNGCPFCSGKRPIVGETDLATTYPEVAAEWDYERNGNLRPTDVTYRSGKKVFWLCEHGHSWETRICERTYGKGCPYCSGRYPIVGKTDLATLYPEIAAEWDYERNGNLRPTDVTAKSNKKVSWICAYGHSWEAIINNRARGDGCPFCAGKQPHERRCSNG